MRFDVYMPATSAGHQYGILHGSGIVGTVQGDGRLMIDYEGDVARAAQMVTFADRIHRAASRHASLYPTSARDIVLTAEFAHLATYDYATGVVDLTTGMFDLEDTQDLLCEWLEVSREDLEPQLATRGSSTLQFWRELTSLRKSRDRDQIAQAKRMAKLGHPVPAIDPAIQHVRRFRG